MNILHRRPSAVGWRTLRFNLEKLGHSAKTTQPQPVGHHFIHKTLGYRGVILHSYQSQLHHHLKHEKNIYQHLVLVDEIDATSKYPFMSFASIKHRNVGGGLTCTDIVRSDDILPYSRPLKTIKNSCLESFFFPLNIYPTTTPELQHTVLSPRTSLELLENEVNTNSRSLENNVKLPDLEIDSTVYITAFCLANNVSGTSNWIVSVNFKDEGSQIQYAMLNLTVVEKVDNTFHFRAANPDDICDTIHFTRTVKLREPNQIGFVQAEMKYKKSGVHEWIKMKSPIIVLIGRPMSKMSEISS